MRTLRKRTEVLAHAGHAVAMKGSRKTDPSMPDDRAEEYAREVAARIVQARKELSLTQKELAELAGVSDRSMQGYENAEVVPYRRMRDLARVLNRPVEWLLHGDEAVTPSEKRLEALESKLDEILKRLPPKK